MKYLYGDATQFPLEENFIETLSAATDACVGIFQVDLDLQDRRDRAASIGERASEELGYLNSLARVVEKALAPMIPKDEAVYAAQRTASAIARSAQATIEQAKEAIVRERESSVKGTIGSDLAGRVHQSLAAFLVTHQLPNTRWAITWRYRAESNQSDLFYTSVAECGISAEYRGSIPDDERWSVPLRISDIGLIDVRTFEPVDLFV